MTPEERFWRRLQRLAGDLQPELNRALILSLSRLRKALPEAELIRLLETGDVLEVLGLLNATLLDDAFAPLVIALTKGTRASLQSGVATVQSALPRTAAQFTITPNAPRVVTSTGALTQKVVKAMQADVRATLLQIIERSVRDGVNPRVVARDLRASLGLSAAQERQVQNFRRALETGDTAKALGYERRDRRFDAKVRKGDLTPAEIEKMTDRYRERRVALNAEAVTRTAALDSQRAAQRLAWDEAIADGIVREKDLRRRWVTILDGRERQTHNAMNGTVVGFDEPFDVPGVGPQVEPGESEWNCRCTAWVFTARD